MGKSGPVRRCAGRHPRGTACRHCPCYPVWRLPGIATLPSSVDALFSSAGVKSLANQGLSVDGKVQIAEANTVSFVARDSLGRKLKVTQPLLTAAPLVERGCGDYSVGLGRVREDFALASNTYGELFANTRVLCGIPLGFTLEGHGEYLAGQGGAVGVGLARRIDSVGTASVGLASSRDAADSGWLARFSFEHTNPVFNLNLRTLVQSPGFRRVGTAPTDDPAARSSVASFGVKLGTASDVAVVYAAETTQARQSADFVALSQRMRLDEFNTLSMTAGSSMATDNILSIYMSFTRAFGASMPAISALPDALKLIRAPQKRLRGIDPPRVQFVSAPS